MFRVISHEAASLSGITSPSILAELVTGVEGNLDQSVDHAQLALGKPRQRIFCIPIFSPVAKKVVLYGVNKVGIDPRQSWNSPGINSHDCTVLHQELPYF